MSYAASASHRSRPAHPILKRDSSPFRTPALPSTTCGPTFSPHVHFPPTPRIAATYPAYSPTTYDRKPIAVSPNVVQLPKRGERRLQSTPADLEGELRGRGRSRSRGGGHRVSSDEAFVKGSYFHPRAYEACKPEPTDTPAPSIDFVMPPLVQDLSPSDESDDPVLTPPGESLPAHAIATRAIPLHLPDFPQVRPRSSTEVAGASRPPLTSLPAPLRPHPHGQSGRQNSKRVVRGLERKHCPRLFSPDRDEGCLGGF